MAHRKAGGSAKNLRDSNPKFLGVKVNHGEKVGTGEIIIRQRGTKYMPGKNTKTGKDHTVFSMKDGTVSFERKNRKSFTGSIKKKVFVNVNEQQS